MQKEIDLKLDLLNREKLRELYAEQDEEFAEMLDEYDLIKSKLDNINVEKPVARAEIETVDEPQSTPLNNDDNSKKSESKPQTESSTQENEPRLVDMYIEECFLGTTKLIEKSVPMEKVPEKVREYVKKHYVGLGLYHKLTIDEKQNRVVYDFGSHYDFIIAKPTNFKVDHTEMGMFI